MKRLIRMATAVALTTAGLATIRTTTAAHEKGILKLADRRLVPGTEARVAGEKFRPRAGLALTIEGVAGKVSLGKVTADSAGRFTASLHIPADLPLGTCRLVARASDGDEVAALDVEVVIGGAPAAVPTSGARDDHAPSPEPLALRRARSPWVTGGAAAAIVVALVAGTLLLRRSNGAGSIK